MKKIFLALIAATVIGAPMAQAQDFRHGPDHNRRPVVVQKKTVVTHRWTKGHRTSAAERRHMSEVRDYRRYRLSAPPRGYHWVKADNQYLLVGIATGVISSIIASH
jgi:Ni/Co efflux regulator RcnB